eukprot:gene17336-biopygen10243
MHTNVLVRLPHRRRAAPHRAARGCAVDEAVDARVGALGARPASFPPDFLLSASQGIPALALRRYPLLLLEVGLVAAAAGAVLLDWGAVSRLGDPQWPLCVIVLDALLVGDARDWASRCIIALVLGWLALERAEQGVRYGLYEAAQFDGELPMPEPCDCAAPPCARRLYLPALGFALSVFIFLADFRR